MKSSFLPFPLSPFHPFTLAANQRARFFRNPATTVLRACADELTKAAMTDGQTSFGLAGALVHDGRSSNGVSDA